MSRTTTESRLAAREDVLSCNVGEDGAVLLDPRAGIYLGLEGSGAVIWARLSRGAATIAELCEAVAADYEVTANACEPDVRAFVDDLLRRGLVTRMPEEASAAHGD
jgi:hypothetical protein